MGWFGTSEAVSPQTTSTPAIKDPPGRVKRAQCWDSRDLFFKCLDKSNILDSVKEDEKARAQCPAELEKFEQNCAASWVQYFKQRRVAEYDKAQLLKREEELMAKNK